MWRKTVAGRGRSSSLGQLEVFLQLTSDFFLCESKCHQPWTWQAQRSGKRWKGYFHDSQPGKTKWECLPKKSGHCGFSWKTQTLLFPLFLCVVSEGDWIVSVPMVFAYTKRNETLSDNDIYFRPMEQQAKQLPRGCFLSMTLKAVWEQAGCSLRAQAELLETSKVPTTSSTDKAVCLCGQDRAATFRFSMGMASKQGQLESGFSRGSLREAYWRDRPICKSWMHRFQTAWTLKRYSETGSGSGPQKHSIKFSYIFTTSTVQNKSEINPANLHLRELSPFPRCVSHTKTTSNTDYFIPPPEFWSSRSSFGPDLVCLYFTLF